ncbi:CCDC90 family protein [Candidatus Bandiella euplotis]|uniref:DUF1640 domain-containing protein n=1 Tax=Candidatus Bandiella euplotis TaxID=1664265 RepID=A0ABZ0UM93_9RICK|nr:hypothetical protein [Candidatus Bandiella woodruffii]WPX96376.1 DUF1640 domain-containing protein [Candidatus Bandiella woodruffii]
MHYKTFDTHKYIKELQATGFDEKQAETLVRSLLASRDFDLSVLATREQVTELDSKVENLETKLTAEISSVRNEVSNLEVKLNGRMDNLEAKLNGRMDKIEAKVDMIKWIIPILLANFAMVAAIMIKMIF